VTRCLCPAPSKHSGGAEMPGLSVPARLNWIVPPALAGGRSQLTPGARRINHTGRPHDRFQSGVNKTHSANGCKLANLAFLLNFHNQCAQMPPLPPGVSARIEMTEIDRPSFGLPAPAAVARITPRLDRLRRCSWPAAPLSAPLATEWQLRFPPPVRGARANIAWRFRGPARDAYPRS